MLAMVVSSVALTVAAWLSAGGTHVDLTWLRDLFRAASG
jgi:hypothetical protein